MSHKKILLPITLGVFALGVSVASSPVMASASASEWIVGGGSPKVTDVENGVSMTGTSGWEYRLGYKDILPIDGLSFDLNINGFSADQSCRGFYFFSADTAASEAYYPYFNSQSSTVFTMWSIFKQARLYCMPDHNYNTNGNALNVNGTGSTAAKGFSSSDNALICDISDSFSLNFKFARENDDFYKVTITATDIKIWGNGKNDVSIYNRDTSDLGSITTYISKENMHVNSAGFARMGTVGLGTDGTVQYLNLNYRSDVEFSNLPTTYNAGEDLDVSGITAVESWKLGTKTNIDASDLTVTGYDKTKTGDQEVTVSYKGFSKTFTVRNKASVDAADAFGTTFLAKTETPCADPNANNKEALEKVWSEIEESYTALTDDAKTIVKSTAANNAGTDLEKAVALYDHIVARYGNSFNFMERSVQSSASNYLINENTTSFIPLIVIVTLASVTFIGAALIIRKRKEN